MPELAMPRVISLTTDFGLDDAYVGMMKGAILAIAPDVQIVDITHSVEPGDLLEAAFLVGTSCKFFPPETIHVVVVDPGVGTERRAIALDTPAGTFVAPDNGVLSWVISERMDQRMNPPSGVWRLKGTPRKAGQGEYFKATSLTNPKFWRPEASATFHGRDIFGPVAAHLARGTPLAQLGEPIHELVAIDLPIPEKQANGLIVGHIIHVDHFGNIITDLTPADLAGMPGEPIFEIVGHSTVGLSRNYQEKAGLLAIAGSSGQIELAMSGGNAARELLARKTDVVVVRPTF